MYAGRIVETGPVDDGLRIAAAPVHEAPARLAAGDRRRARARAADSRARRRIPATRPAAAASTRAARTGRSAATSIRRCARSRPGHGSACHYAPWCEWPEIEVRPSPPRRSAHERDPGGEIGRRDADERQRRRGRFEARRKTARALDGVSLEWRPGEILGVVGESGCGKSTLARAMLGLQPTVGGRVPLERQTSIAGKSEQRALRKRVQMIFQDPYQTLNPRQRVAAIVTEPLKVQGVPKRRARRAGAAGAWTTSASTPIASSIATRISSRGAAPAGGDRGRARPRARRADLRRAGLDARRLGAGADPQRARQPAEAARPGADLHHPRPQPRLVALRPDRGHVPGPDRRGGAVGGRDRATHSIPTRRRWSPRSRCRPRAAAGGASCSRASCPTRPRFRPAAASIRAVRAASSRATASTRSWSRPAGPVSAAACLLHDPAAGGRAESSSTAGGAGAISSARSAGSRPARGTRSPTSPGSGSARPGGQRAADRRHRRRAARRCRRPRAPRRSTASAS